MSTPGLDPKQVAKAVGALLKHVAKQKKAANDLIEEDELLQLVGCCCIQASLLSLSFATEWYQDEYLPLPYMLKTR